MVEQPRNSSRWLNSTVLGFGLASFFSDVGLECTAVLLPVLMTSLGGSSLILGLIEGSADGLSCLARLLAGRYSDRGRGRKPVAVLTYLLVAGGMPSLALATRWWHLLLGRVVTSIGRGSRTPVRNVLLAEASRPEHFGRVFGFERAMDSAGAFVGPLLALLLVEFVAVGDVFALSFVPGLLAALLVIALVREQGHSSPVHPPSEGRRWALPVPFRRFLFGVGVAGLGDFSNLLLVLWATQAWTPEFGPTRAAQMAMLFYVGYNAVFTLSCAISGRLADRYPRHRVLALGYVLAVVPAVVLLVPGASLVKFAVAFTFSGIYMGIVETLETAIAATILPQSVRGTGFGALAAVNGLGDFLSSLMVGLLWGVYPAAAMGFVILTTLMGAAIIATTRRRDAEIGNGE